MKYANIDRNTFGYWFLKNLLAKPLFKFYYHKFVVRNAHHIPENAPVILAANHQNALIDALAMLFSNKYQPVFVARADIFKKPFVVKILVFLKIMPIFRIRDGAKNLKQNEEIFDAAIRILDNQINPFAIMPEGNHGDKRMLRNFQKGIFRIALKAQEKYGENPGVKIVPMGLNYDHYQNVYRPLLINYGKPIEVADYFSESIEDQAVTMNKMKTDLFNAIKKLMIHIESDTYYETYWNLIHIYYKKTKVILDEKNESLWNKFRADKILIDLLDKKLEQDPEWMQRIAEKTEKYLDIVKSLKLRDWVFRKKRYSFIGLFFQFIMQLILFPFFVLGVLNNYLIFGIPPKLTRKIKDPQFVSSVKYVIALILMIISYLILTICAIIFIPVLWIKLLYIFTLPLTGIFAFRYFIKLKKLFAKLRYNLLFIRKNKTVITAYNLHDEIIRMLDDYIMNTPNEINHEVYQ